MLSVLRQTSIGLWAGPRGMGAASMHAGFTRQSHRSEVLGVRFAQQSGHRLLEQLRLPHIRGLCVLQQVDLTLVSWKAFRPETVPSDLFWRRMLLKRSEMRGGRNERHWPDDRPAGQSVGGDPGMTGGVVVG